MNMRNSRGQMILEAVLLMTIFLAITAAIAASLKKNEAVTRLVQGPWQNLSGLLQNGVWQPPKTSQPMHPSVHSRHISLQGDNPR